MKQPSANTDAQIKPQIVVFDLGKVLVDFDYDIAARRIAARGGKSAREVTEFFVHSPLLYQYEMGRMSKAEFYKAVREGAGYCGNIDEFVAAFSDIFTPIEPMVQLHAELHDKGIPTFVFSNTNELAVNHIKNRFPFFGKFDGYIYSFEHGVMKPDPRIYEILEKMSGKRGPEVFYLDDRSENIAGAAQRQWQALLHESPEQTRQAVAALGLLNEC